MPLHLNPYVCVYFTFFSYVLQRLSHQHHASALFLSTFVSNDACKHFYSSASSLRKDVAKLTFFPYKDLSIHLENITVAGGTPSYTRHECALHAKLSLANIPPLPSHSHTLTRISPSYIFPLPLFTRVPSPSHRLSSPFFHLLYIAHCPIRKQPDPH